MHTRKCTQIRCIKRNCDPASNPMAGCIIPVEGENQSFLGETRRREQWLFYVVCKLSLSSCVRV